jgi:hypothetical protein
MGTLNSDLSSGLEEQSEGAVVAVDGAEPGVDSPESDPLNTTGELSDMNRKKSV